MKKYDKYSSGVVSWLKEVPAHWGSCRFKDIFDLCKGLTITKADLEDIGVPVVNYGDIHSRFGFEVDPERHSLFCVNHGYLKSSKKSLLNPGDFVFADTSEDTEGSGNFTHLVSKIPIFAGYHTIIARPKGNRPRYLAYLADSHLYRNQVRSSVKGVKVYSITKGILNPLQCLLPPIPEQIAIASYLDRETSRIDGKVALLEEKARLYKELKQSLINETVTRGLDPSAPFRESGVGWIGEIPEHWKVRRNKDLFRQLKRKAGAKSSEYAVLSLTLKGVIKRDMENIKGKVPASFDSYLVCKPGDLVICLFDMDVTPQIVGLVKDTGIITSAYTLVEAFKGVSVYYFLYYYLAQNKNGSLLAHSKTLRSTMTFDLFCQVEVPLPPLEEQQAIATYLDEKTSKIDQIVEAIAEQVRLLKELRKTLINDVVTGKIRVTEIEGGAA
jgi:type I restriction enzyme S subunit